MIELMRKQKGFAPLILLIGLVLIIGIAGGVYYFVKSQVLKSQPPNPMVISQTPQPTSASSVPQDETANWKTYSGKLFSFKYPNTLYLSETEDGSIHLYRNKTESVDSLNCIKNNLGTLAKPCGQGQLDIFDAGQTPGRQPVESYLKSNDPALPKVDRYQDTQGRQWLILGPTYGVGSTQTNAELENDNKHQVQIHIRDSYIDANQSGGIDEETILIQQILSTFKFTQ